MIGLSLGGELEARLGNLARANCRLVEKEFGMPQFSMNNVGCQSYLRKLHGKRYLDFIAAHPVSKSSLIRPIVEAHFGKSR